MNGRQSLTVYQGMHGMSENVFINAKNMSHTITAEVETPGGAAVNGAIIAQAGRFGGWSLYVKDGKPTYTYNYLGLSEYTISSPQALPAGKATIRFEFAYDGGGRGKGGMGKIFVNGTEVAKGRIENTEANLFSADEGTDVGFDEGTAVSSSYSIPFRFNGKIRKVTVDLKSGTTARAERGQRDAMEKLSD
jgi:arylsulfatase